MFYRGKINYKKIYLGLFLSTFFLVVFLSSYKLVTFLSFYTFSTKPIIGNFIVTQAPIIPGQSVHWVKTVSLKSVNSAEHLLAIPKGARLINISTSTTEQVITKKTADIDRAELVKLSLQSAKSEASQALAKQIKRERATGFWASVTRSFFRLNSFFATVSEVALDDSNAEATEVTLVDLAPIVEETTGEEIIVVEPELTTGEDTTTEDLPEPVSEAGEIATTSEEIISEATTTEDLSESVSEAGEIATTTENNSDSGGGGGSGADDETPPPPLDDSGTPPNLGGESEEATTTATTTSTSTDLVQVEYETPAPVIAEAETDTGKIVSISSTSTEQDVITNVLAFTNIPEIYKVGQEDKIKIKWTNNGDQNVVFKAYDLNNNGRLDYVEWTVPHLSEQIFEIIFISKAFELDENKEIINDIYDTVKTKDNTWASIPNIHTVRATFFTVLNETKDITIYAKPLDGGSPSQIRVYPVYTDGAGNITTGREVATFPNIDHEGKYKILLTGLNTPTDMFDLQIVGGAGVAFDFIVDPNILSTNGTGGGNWADGSTWALGAPPVFADGDTCEVVAGDTIDNVPAGEVCSTNYGTITVNNGTITLNSGTVTYNNGTITTNALGATVGGGIDDDGYDVGRANTGYIGTNEGTILGNGLFSTHAGTVDVNNGSITGNNWGLITTNNGLIFRNGNGGTVTTNSTTGTMGDINFFWSGNSGLVTTNDGLIINNYWDGVMVGTVTTNSSTGIINNNIGEITTNNGIVGLNSPISGGEPSYPGLGLITTNNLTVTTNDGTVATNASAGTVVTNNAAVNHNDGEVSDNTGSGTTHNYDGTVVTTSGIVYIYSTGTVDTKTSGTVYLDQTASGVIDLHGISMETEAGGTITLDGLEDTIGGGQLALTVSLTVPELLGVPQIIDAKLNVRGTGIVITGGISFSIFGTAVYIGSGFDCTVDGNIINTNTGGVGAFGIENFGTLTDVTGTITISGNGIGIVNGSGGIITDISGTIENDSGEYGIRNDSGGTIYDFTGEINNDGKTGIYNEGSITILHGEITNTNTGFGAAIENKGSTGEIATLIYNDGQVGILNHPSSSITTISGAIEVTTANGYGIGNGGSITTISSNINMSGGSGYAIQNDKQGGAGASITNITGTITDTVWTSGPFNVYAVANDSYSTISEISGSIVNSVVSYDSGTAVNITGTVEYLSSSNPAGAANISSTGTVVGCAINIGTNDGTIGTQWGLTVTTNNGIVTTNSAGGTIGTTNSGGTVTDNYGTITAGTFIYAVHNYGTGVINGGTFSEAVINEGAINAGTFTHSITNSGTISGATLNLSGQNVDGYSLYNTGTITGAVNFSGATGGKIYSTTTLGDVIVGDGTNSATWTLAEALYVNSLAVYASATLNANDGVNPSWPINISGQDSSGDSLGSTGTMITGVVQFSGATGGKITSNTALGDVTVGDGVNGGIWTLNSALYANSLNVAASASLTCILNPVYLSGQDALGYSLNNAGTFEAIIYFTGASGGKIYNNDTSIVTIGDGVNGGTWTLQDELNALSLNIASGATLNTNDGTNPSWSVNLSYQNASGYSLDNQGTISGAPNVNFIAGMGGMIKSGSSDTYKLGDVTFGDGVNGGTWVLQDALYANSLNIATTAGLNTNDGVNPSWPINISGQSTPYSLNNQGTLSGAPDVNFTGTANPGFILSGSSDTYKLGNVTVGNGAGSTWTLRDNFYANSLNINASDFLNGSGGAVYINLSGQDASGYSLNNAGHIDNYPSLNFTSATGGKILSGAYGSFSQVVAGDINNTGAWIFEGAITAGSFAVTGSTVSVDGVTTSAIGQSYTASGGITINGALSANAHIDFYSPVTLGTSGGDMDAGGHIIFSSTVTGDGTQYLDLNAGWEIIITGDATNLGKFSATSVSFSGSAIVSVAGVTTTSGGLGSQYYAATNGITVNGVLSAYAPISFANAVTLGTGGGEMTAGAYITFDSTITGDGTQTLNLDALGAITIVGEVSGLNSFSANSLNSTVSVGAVNAALTQDYTATGGITINGMLLVGGNIDFFNPVTLGTGGGDMDAGGYIKFTSTVNGGGRDLILNASGAITIADSASNIAAFVVNSTGSTVSVAGVSTIDPQNYTAAGGITINGTLLSGLNIEFFSPVTLGVSGGDMNASGYINFASTVTGDGSQSLDFTAGGSLGITGAVSNIDIFNVSSVGDITISGDILSGDYISIISSGGVNTNDYALTASGTGADHGYVIIGSQTWVNLGDVTSNGYKADVNAGILITAPQAGSYPYGVGTGALRANNSNGNIKINAGSLYTPSNSIEADGWIDFFMIGNHLNESILVSDLIANGTGADNGYVRIKSAQPFLSLPVRTGNITANGYLAENGAGISILGLGDSQPTGSLQIGTLNSLSDIGGILLRSESVIGGVGTPILIQDIGTNGLTAISTGGVFIQGGTGTDLYLNSLDSTENIGISGDNIILKNNISSLGGMSPSIFTGPVTVAGDINIRLDNMSFTSTIKGDTDGTSSLTLDTGASGTILVSGAVGGDNKDLLNLTLSILPTTTFSSTVNLDGTLFNHGTILAGTFNAPVTNTNTISGGTYNNSITFTTNNSTITNSDFTGATLTTDAVVTTIDPSNTWDGTTIFNLIAPGYYIGHYDIGTWNGSVDGDLNNQANWSNGYPCATAEFTATIPAEGVTNWPSTGTCEASVLTNNGTISGGTFTGIVTNNGTIDDNTSTVDVNNGTITINDATVDMNSATGIITTNNLTVTDNSGIVTTNSALGTVTTNNLTVTTNDGTVTTNSATGIITTNNSIVNTNDGEIVTNNPSFNLRTYGVGTYPQDITVDQTGNIWTADVGSNTVTKLNSITGAVIGTYGVGTYPQGITVDLAGNIWVANRGSSNVTKLDSSTGATIGTYGVGTMPYNITVDLAGNIWVTDIGLNAAIKLDSSTGATLGIYGVGAGHAPYYITVDQSGNIWTANNGSGVTKFNSITGTIIGTYYIEGSDPFGITVDQAGNIWVTNYGSSNITKLDSSTGATIGTYGVGTNPYGITIDRVGNIWVTNYGSSNITKLDSSTGATIGTYGVGTRPQGITVDQSGNIWVAYSNSSSVAKLDGSVTTNGTITNNNGTTDTNSGVITTNNGTVTDTTEGGTINTNSATGIISGGIFSNPLLNEGTLTTGTFNALVTNTGTISGGIYTNGITFTTNNSTISNSDFTGATLTTDAVVTTIDPSNTWDGTTNFVEINEGTFLGLVPLPTLDYVTIYSSNADNTLATIGDSAIIDFSSEVDLQDTPVVTIGGLAADVVSVGDNKHWTAIRIITGDEPEGNLDFSIDFIDIEGNSGRTKTTTTDDSAVSADFTAPTGTITLGADAVYSATTSPVIILTTDDAVQYQLCLDSATSTNNCSSIVTAWASYIATPTAYNFGSDGTKTLYVQFKDAVGNISATYSDDITIDTTAPTCTSFTYSDWSSCVSGSQSRTVATSTPLGCTGGTPELTQSCSSGGGVNYENCIYTYSEWSACVNNEQSRTATPDHTYCTNISDEPISRACNITPVATTTPATTTYPLIINSVSGTVTKSPAKLAYEQGEVVSLIASSSPGYIFSSWTGNVASTTASSTTVTINATTTITANFVLLTCLENQFVNPQGQCENKPDLCSNILEVQIEIPLGKVRTDDGRCVIDMCPNIDGLQETVPVDKIVDGAGSCVIKLADVCSNIDGVQDSVPAGKILEEGSCVEAPSDFCPNISGIQSALPAGMIITDGECVYPENDVCPNIAGVQTGVPVGMYLDDANSCVSEGVVDPEILPIDVPDNTDKPRHSSADQTVIENIVAILDISDFIADNADILGTTTEQVVLEVKKVLESPTGNVVAKTITTAGVVGGGIAATGVFALNGTVVADLFFLPFKLWGLLLSVLGLKKRNRPWGTVYDSVTKQPIDPAYVTITNLETKEDNMSITDLDGRYGFLVAPGKYTLSANKTNYTFPSKKLASQTADVLYGNLYFGEEIVNPVTGAVISKNIPLDPVKFDWNEFTKGQKKLMKFYSKREKIMRIITDWIFRIGFVISLVSLFLVSAPYNLIIFGLYLVLYALRKIGLKQKAAGSLTDKEGNPLSFAIIRVFDAELNVEITNKVANQIGRYYCLVNKGKYYVKVERKNDDESYTEVLTSPVFEAENGIVNKNFVI